MLKFFNKKLIIIALTLLAVIALRYVWGAYEYRYVAALNDKNTCFVESDANLIDVVKLLENELKNPSKFIKYAKKHNLEGNIKGGKYIFPENSSYAYIIRHLQGGMQQAVNITFNNIRSLDKLAGVLAQKLEVDSLTLASHLLSDSVAKSYGYNKENFIAMFIPNTYQMYWGDSPRKFTDRMMKEKNNFWTKKRKAKAKELNLSENEVMTLASIVFEETKMSDEMPRVAGVYINRLNKGMKLQADPTVKFAVGDFSLRRILYKHIRLDSPYNTYKYKGLPPAPICMPSIKAIDAVLDYEKHDYIFFCADPNFTGYHKFAVTLKEHNANARSYSKALDKSKIYK
ncbi:MAG: endolytic transglycosylase MltG [Rikenellaceae bacterium]